MTTPKLTLLLAILVAADVAAMPEHSPWPGGVAVLRIPGLARPEVTVGERQAMVVEAAGEWLALVGIPLDQAVPGTVEAHISVPGEETRRIAIDIAAHDYEEQHLTVEGKYVEPPAGELDRIFAERKIINAALNNWRPSSLAEVDMKAMTEIGRAHV